MNSNLHEILKIKVKSAFSKFFVSKVKISNFYQL